MRMVRVVQLSRKRRVLQAGVPFVYSTIEAIKLR